MPGDDFDRVRELFSAFGPVVVRRMFGGAGIYADGVMFGILSDDRIYLKADSATEPNFKHAGSTRFVYLRGGRDMTMSYWELPHRCYDDPDELAQWAGAALLIAQRAALGKRKKSPRM